MENDKSSYEGGAPSRSLSMEYNTYKWPYKLVSKVKTLLIEGSLEV